MQVELIRVHKRGDWYYLKGAVEGRVVEADAHSVSIEDRPGHPVDANINRALIQIYNHERTKE